jgi:hypothetical protein
MRRDERRQTPRRRSCQLLGSSIVRHWDVGESLASRPALPPAHSSLEHDHVANLALKSRLQSAEMIGFTGQDEG